MNRGSSTQKLTERRSLREKSRTASAASDCSRPELELRRLQRLMGIGHELKVTWLPGKVEYRYGKQLAEEVRGNMIFVYAESGDEAVELVRHGFLEWLLNQHTRPYRELINLLIMLFEEQQYRGKEKVIESLLNALC